MKTLFIAAGPYSWGSSRMRAYWPARYMGADVMTWDELQAQGSIDTNRWDAYVFQKVIDVGWARGLRSAGKKVWWDICDPMWWWMPDACRAIAPEVTGVVCSGEALAEDFKEWRGGDGCGVHTIPDRLELSHFPLRRTHNNVTPVRLIWFGLGINRIALFAAMANLDRLHAHGHKFELTIFDNAPGQTFVATDNFPVYHVQWDVERENEVIAAHDIALLPPYPGPWGKVKSNNKALTAGACGLPVATGEDYTKLETLVAHVDARKRAAEIGLQMMHQHYTADQSASDWARLLNG